MTTTTTTTTDIPLHAAVMHLPGDLTEDKALFLADQWEAAGRRWQSYGTRRDFDQAARCFAKAKDFRAKATRLASQASA